MPPRLERRQQTGNLHFITFSCHGRNPCLASPASKILFEQILEQTRIRHDFRIIGYVVMPEHVHLLITEPAIKPLNLVIAVLKRTVSHQLPEKPFWLPRYYDFNVVTNEKRLEKLRYTHRNPVHRGLVATPEDYPYSSFRAYGLLEKGIVSIDTGINS